MATSSIYHNIVINDPGKADAFITAIEASIADPYKRADISRNSVNSDPEISKRLSKMRKKNREEN